MRTVVTPGREEITWADWSIDEGMLEEKRAKILKTLV